MPIDYIVEISKHETHASLLEILDLLDKRSMPSDWAPGKVFEHVILRAFQIENADVTWPYPVDLGNGVDEQIDGAVYYEWLNCLVEAKDYSGPVNFEPIAKLRAQLSRRLPGTLGLVFARNGFTDPAITLTRMTNPTNVLLWEFSELQQALRDKAMIKSLQTKVRYAIEYGLPDYNIEDGHWSGRR